MTISDAASIAVLVADLVALYFLVGIWKDDRAMRIATENSLKIQLEYLGLRKKWYDSRVKKKDNAQRDSQEQKGTVGVPDGADKNSM